MKIDLTPKINKLQMMKTFALTYSGFLCMTLLKSMWGFSKNTIVNLFYKRSKIKILILLKGIY